MIFFFRKAIFICGRKNVILSKKKEIWKKLFRRKNIIFFEIFFCGRFFFVGEICFFLEKKIFFVRKKISGEKVFFVLKKKLEKTF